MLRMVVSRASCQNQATLQNFLLSSYLHLRLLDRLTCLGKFQDSGAQ
ncbi:uncharacterized protein RCC_01719 [Ramularia collo-cygni]|uniref:Uncharacterized protein n=1 Tax=Ramularia collo-cygni TaxID=112498 RepID=A0A2D3UMY8_9PEZI|nr:uncharacterized protein RCC_01719 [Ramularia collo-cygni]CZT15881.1 uncharacterized protein RCC_01719 [Ramularia collo-cygni]